MADTYISTSSTGFAEEIHVNPTHESRAAEVLRHIAAGMAGGDAGEYAHYVRGLKYRLAMTLLACVAEAFVVKSSGGIGDDGIRWAPLKKATIAARRIGPGDVPGLKAHGITSRKYGFGARRQSAKELDADGRLKRGFMTDAQDKQWRKIFAMKKAQLMAYHGLSDGAASARAAAIAWATLKAQGAKTKLEVLGGRVVAIGRDTGRGLASLSPASYDPDHFPITGAPPQEVPDQVLRVDEPGGIIVGTNVAYMKYFHAKRPLWPEYLPEPWKRRMADALQSGIQEIIQGLPA